MPSTDLKLVAVNVGNTNTTLGVFASVARGSAPVHTERLATGEPEVVADALVRLAREHLGESSQSAIVVASVNEGASEAVIGLAEPRTAERVYRIGRDLPVPIGRALPPESLVGADRLLSALAAWDMLGQACIVVDTGTAITVDFVDGEGVFQGGAIAPGLAMSLRALHEQTAALPSVEPGPPDGDAFGKTSAQAMLHGVYYGARGLVRLLAERYAEAYEAYPPVVACGGDAEMLFGDDELVDRVVPDLTMRGIAAACRLALLEGPDDPGDGDGDGGGGGDGGG